MRASPSTIATWSRHAATVMSTGLPSTVALRLSSSLPSAAFSTVSHVPRVILYARVVPRSKRNVVRQRPSLPRCIATAALASHAPSSGRSPTM